MGRNTLIPLPRQALTQLLETGQALTVRNMRAYLERDVPSYKQLTAAVNPEQAARALTTNAIRTVLDELPAYPTEGGFVHVDLSRPQELSVYQRLIDYRAEQIGDLEASRSDLENLRDAAKLRDQIVAGMPESERVG